MSRASTFHPKTTQQTHHPPQTQRKNASESRALCAALSRFVLYVHPKSDPSLQLWDFVDTNAIPLNVVNRDWPPTPTDAHAGPTGTLYDALDGGGDTRSVVWPSTVRVVPSLVDTVSGAPPLEGTDAIRAVEWLVDMSLAIYDSIWEEVASSSASPFDPDDDDRDNRDERDNRDNRDDRDRMHVEQRDDWRNNKNVQNNSRYRNNDRDNSGDDRNAGQDRRDSRDLRDLRDRRDHRDLRDRRDHRDHRDHSDHSDHSDGGNHGNHGNHGNDGDDDGNDGRNGRNGRNGRDSGDGGGHTRVRDAPAAGISGTAKDDYELGLQHLAESNQRSRSVGFSSIGIRSGTGLANRDDRRDDQRDGLRDDHSDDDRGGGRKDLASARELENAPDRNGRQHNGGSSSSSNNNNNNRDANESSSSTGKISEEDVQKIMREREASMPKRQQVAE